MLYYTEVCLSPYEVPEHKSICIYISGCLNKCAECHYPLLQRMDYGDILYDKFINIIDLYRTYATCVCFLGEGKNTIEEHNEFNKMIAYAHQKGLKTCLYCGRDTIIESWMKNFDYIKLGSYQVSLGGLSNISTNQKMLQKINNDYIDITYKFKR